MGIPLASPPQLEVFALPYGPKTGTMQTPGREEKEKSEHKLSRLEVVSV